jgi:GNAT superfamily N-acetyltransferase
LPNKAAKELLLNQLKAKIRKATADDAAAAWEIRNAAIRAGCPAHYPAEALAIWTAGEVTEGFVRSVVEKFYVATVDEVVVATGMINCNTGKLDAIFVRPDMMRRGIGRQMVAFLEDVALVAGLTQLTLEATLNAAAFYRSCGFVGETPGEFRSPRGISLACIPMTKSL